MKTLRNPYVISVLVALALVLGYFRFRAPPVVAAPPPVEKPRPKIVGPDASVELDQLGWTPSPTREPFRAAATVPVVATISDHEAEPVADVLNLKAVWLQEGGGWVVINGKVLGVGDAILGFRVEKISADGVLVQGPSGRRQVGFKPASARPRPAPVLAASPRGKAPLKPTPGKPLTLHEGAKALQPVFAQENTAATGRSKSPEKSSP
ncbi:MAG: hypothetical protein ACAH88_20195 [Roseimicrobium sp.]